MNRRIHSNRRKLTPEQRRILKEKEEQRRKKSHKARRKAIVWAISIMVVAGFSIYKFMMWRNTNYYLDKGYAFFEQEEFWRAKRCAQAALYYSPKSSEAYFLYARVLVDDSYSSYWSGEARHLLEKTIEYSSEPTLKMKFLLGKCYYKLNDFDKALPLLKEVYLEDKQLDSLDLFIAKIQVSQGKKENAILYYESFLKRKKISLPIAKEVGTLFFQMTNFQKARPLLKIASETDNEGKYTEMLLNAYCEDGMEEEACEIYRKLERPNDMLSLIHI